MLSCKFNIFFYRLQMLSEFSILIIYIPWSNIILQAKPACSFCCQINDKEPKFYGLIKKLNLLNENVDWVIESEKVWSTNEPLLIHKAKEKPWPESQNKIISFIRAASQDNCSTDHFSLAGTHWNNFILLARINEFLCSLLGSYVVFFVNFYRNFVKSF